MLDAQYYRSIIPFISINSNFLHYIYLLKHNCCFVRRSLNMCNLQKQNAIRATVTVNFIIHKVHSISTQPAMEVNLFNLNEINCAYRNIRDYFEIIRQQKKLLSDPWFPIKFRHRGQFSPIPDLVNGCNLFIFNDTKKFIFEL